MKSNVYIDLTYNALKGIALFYLDRLTYQTNFKMYLDVRENPIFCDCINAKLLQYINGNLEENIYKYVAINTENLKCRGPEKHSGKLFWTLKNNDLSCQVKAEIATKEQSACTYEFFFETKLTITNCANKNLSDIPVEIAFIGGFTVELHMENNNLEYIPFFDSTKSKSITKLYLSGNKIKDLDGIASFINLEVNIKILLFTIYFYYYHYLFKIGKKHVKTVKRGNVAIKNATLTFFLN